MTESLKNKKKIKIAEAKEQNTGFSPKTGKELCVSSSSSSCKVYQDGNYRQKILIMLCRPFTSASREGKKWKVHLVSLSCPLWLYLEMTWINSGGSRTQSLLARGSLTASEVLGTGRENLGDARTDGKPLYFVTWSAYIESISIGSDQMLRW